MKISKFMKDYGIIIFIVLIIIAFLCTICFSNYRIWNNVIDHSDDFKVEYIQENYMSFVLYDTCDIAPRYICDVFINCTDKSASVFYGSHIIASSFNFYKSHKAFNKFYKRIYLDKPKGKGPDFNPKKEALDGFNRLYKK